MKRSIILITALLYLVTSIGCSRQSRTDFLPYADGTYTAEEEHHHDEEEDDEHEHEDEDEHEE